jgi:hypothetical protein
MHGVRPIVIASEAKQSSRAPKVRKRKCATWRGLTLDCFVAEPVIGRRYAPTRWLLAMTLFVMAGLDPAIPLGRALRP